MFPGLQTFLLELPENGQRQPATLTIRHRYMYTVTEALYNTQILTGSQNPAFTEA